MSYSRNKFRGRGINFQPAGGSGGGASIPPPPSLTTSNFRGGGGVGGGGAFASITAIHQQQATIQDTYTAALKKRNRTEDMYFEEDEEEQLAYIPAPGSPSYKGPPVSVPGDSDDDDPLDAFMAGIETQVKKETVKKEEKGVRDDIEEEDDEETYYRHVAENPDFGKDLEDSDEDFIEYDEDGNPLAPKKSKWIDPLPKIDHTQINYASFEKNFYEEHPDIQTLTEEQVEELREKLGIKVSGPSPPKPLTSFGHMGFPETLMKSIRKSEFSTPTPIQAQGMPIALGGRDIIGIAKTGSGKTAAFLWPMLIHIADQPELKPGDGPIGLILCPTRELALQIYSEAKKFGKVFGFRVCCCYGGGSKWEQSKDLEKGSEIVVATPGRMIDMVKMKATELSRVSYLVLDEADRMFDMGFEVQVRSICDHVRPDRQTLLFSATFRKKVEKLARIALSDPIRVVQGDIGEANQDVTQIMLLMPLGGARWNWLTSNLVKFTSEGSVLIFVTKKLNAEELYNNLKLQEIDAFLLHGDMDQIERNKVILGFRKKELDILVATDVAARGLDIPHIKTVVNFDVARDSDTHTHRIGRTGRAGEKGTAYTLVTEKDKEIAGHLVRSMEAVGQTVPEDIMELAMKSSWFRKSRFKGGKGKKASTVGLGYKGSASGDSSKSSANYQMPNFQPGSVAGSLMAMSSTITPVNATPIDRQGAMAAMRAAFKTQYQTSFKISEDTKGENTESATSSARNLMPPPPPSFETPNSQLYPRESSSSSTSHSSEDGHGSKKKRSRWN